jgi:hypothetical protein
VGDIVQFRKPKLKQKAKGHTLCKSGFHRWKIVQAKQFDVKQGKLVTLYRCERCDATRTEAQ